MNCEKSVNDFACSKSLSRNRWNSGFTLIELFIVFAIIGTISAIAVPNYIKYRYDALIAVGITDIRMIEKQIALFVQNNGQLPDNLNNLPNNNTINDPWGNPYQYLRINGGPPNAGGRSRKDHFLVPVNSDYDLYSMGVDGQSRPPFTARASQDDIVRANDGEYVGLVSDY